MTARECLAELEREGYEVPLYDIRCNPIIFLLQVLGDASDDLPYDVVKRDFLYAEQEVDESGNPIEVAP